jgi:hypothetical protein
MSVVFMIAVAACGDTVNREGVPRVSLTEPSAVGDRYPTRSSLEGSNLDSSTTETAEARSKVPVTSVVDDQSRTALGSLTFAVPDGLEQDPRWSPNFPEVVIEYGRWIVRGCCNLTVIVQTVEPLIPSDEVVGTFESNGRTWLVYDGGPRDGTELMAVSTDRETSIVVGTQRLEDGTVEPRSMVEQIARSIEYMEGQ